MNLIMKEYPERHFAGIPFEGGIRLGSEDVLHIPTIWQTFFEQVLPQINLETENPHFIGLELYPKDFLQTRIFDYLAMVETTERLSIPGVVSKTIPAGKYFSFEINFDHLEEGIQQSYRYLNDHQIPYDMSFDFEDYLNDQNYSLKDQKLYFSIRVI
ncbi:MAG: GyrI-like domain-containing protein [Candidatus Izemoplasmatales bacterium]